MLGNTEHITLEIWAMKSRRIGCKREGFCYSLCVAEFCGRMSLAMKMDGEHDSVTCRLIKSARRIFGGETFRCYVGNTYIVLNIVGT